MPYIVAETDNYREWSDGTEEVSFSDAELDAMAADPVRFGLARSCGHPTGQGDCMVCEFAGYDEAPDCEVAPPDDSMTAEVHARRAAAHSRYVKPTTR